MPFFIYIIGDRIGFYMRRKNVNKKYSLWKNPKPKENAKEIFV